MRKFLVLILSLIMSLTVLSACGDRGDNGGGNNGGGDNGGDNGCGVKDGLVVDKDSITYGYDNLLGLDTLNDEDNGFTSKDSVKGARFLLNGEYVDEFKSFSSRQDVKMEFYNENNARLVNVSAGTAFTLPADKALSIDYSIAKFRTQFDLGDSILTYSAESSNPYGNNPDPWATYRDEWLLRWLNNDEYITKNNLKRTIPVVYANKAVKVGYDIYMYAVEILDGENLEFPFYNIAVVREANDNINFSLFVMKSKEDKADLMQGIVDSFTKFVAKGIPKNYYDAGEAKVNPNWSTETKEYYAQLMSTKTVGWGAFSYSMPGDEGSLNAGQSNYDSFLKKSREMRDGIQEIWDHDFDIYPTYTHLSWYDQKHHFPVNMANELAGGNGKNGKPVLQFTYQFTNNNNLVHQNVTPMFDILRGNYDEHLERLAQDIKNYGKPVLFRLNNEMNTDWTSYCGMITLLDPDIFIETWKYLYKIFDREGVDNAIWIWNPIEQSCPYSSWGEDLCYNPGSEYVQLLGLTSYEMNNEASKTASFEEMYTRLYKKNSAYFSKWRAIISEFACGSGGDFTGELGRNRDLQAKWVKDMFDCFYVGETKPFAKQIVGGVWFNCNDYVDVQGVMKISNRLRFFDPDSTDYDDLSDTIEAFRLGMKNRRD